MNRVAETERAKSLAHVAQRSNLMQKGESMLERFYTGWVCSQRPGNALFKQHPRGEAKVGIFPCKSVTSLIM